MTLIDEVVRRHVLGAEPDALAEHEAGDETRGAGVQMHDGAAGVVERAELSRASRRPTPNERSGNRRRSARAPMNHRKAENFMRSASAPAISAGVMIAKVIWKNM